MTLSNHSSSGSHQTKREILDFISLGHKVIAFVHLPVWIVSVEVIQEPRQVQMEVRSTAGYPTQTNASEQCNF